MLCLSSSGWLLGPLAVRRLAMAALVSGCGGAGLLESGPDLLGQRLFEQPSQAEGSTRSTGIDVSKFQGDIDWNAVADSGVKFAWTSRRPRAADRADARFEANWEGPRPLASPPRSLSLRSIGAARRSEEIQIFEQNAAGRGRQQLPPVLDAEATRQPPPTCRRHVAQRQRPSAETCRSCCRKMERHYGKRPIIYTSPRFLRGEIFPTAALMDYPIWVRSTKHHPAVKYGSRAWHFWRVINPTAGSRASAATSIGTPSTAQKEQSGCLP